MRFRAALLCTVAAMLVASTAAAHPSGPSPELTVVGRANIAVSPGHITDVWAHGNYAYVGSFDEANCSLDYTGIHIIDISDPTNPRKVGFIPSPPQARANDVKVATIHTPFFSGDVLIHSNEGCTTTFLPRVQADDAAQKRRPSSVESKNGIAIYDVTDPTKPRPLRQNFGRYQVHNTFIYQQGDRAYVLVVDDDHERDLHIVDITNPSAPREVANVGAPDWPQVRDNIGVGEVFLHDVWAQEKDGRIIAYLSYWDAGLVLLDITDPANPVFLGDSDYPDPDPLSGQPPEGNSHVAVPTADGSLVVMGDEDFAPYRSSFTVDTGPYAGPYSSAEGGFTTPIASLPDRMMNGPTTFVGLACNGDPIPPPATANLAPGEEQIALIERGVCRFDEKISNVASAGYTGAVVFNRVDEPGSLVTMAGDRDKGTIPAVFVTRYTGFAILGIAPNSPPDTPLPAVGTAGERVTAKVTFDGWGYARILDVSDPDTIRELGEYATENVFADPPPPGDRTMHNVIVDGRRAYISWYAEGIRVVDFEDPEDPREIAHFVDEENGSNFWGVYLHRHPNGQTYILGSDRDSGLWIFANP